MTERKTGWDEQASNYTGDNPAIAISDSRIQLIEEFNVFLNKLKEEYKDNLEQQVLINKIERELNEKIENEIDIISVELIDELDSHLSNAGYITPNVPNIFANIKTQEFVDAIVHSESLCEPLIVAWFKQYVKDIAGPLALLEASNLSPLYTSLKWGEANDFIIVDGAKPDISNFSLQMSKLFLVITAALKRHRILKKQIELSFQGSLAYVKAKPGLNVRAQPTLGSSRLAYLPHGKDVEIIDQSISDQDRQWVKIKVNKDDWNEEGWVDSQFLTPSSLYLVQPETLNVYESEDESSHVIGTLSQGTQVIFQDDEQNNVQWIKVFNNPGWIKREGLKNASDYADIMMNQLEEFDRCLQTQVTDLQPLEQKLATANLLNQCKQNHTVLKFNLNPEKDKQYIQFLAKRGFKRQLQSTQYNYGLDDLQQRSSIHQPELPIVRLPASVDLSYMLLEIKNQGSLNSCTAHTAVALVEFLNLNKIIQQKNEQETWDKKHRKLSELFVYTATLNLMGKELKPDNGTSMRDTMEAIVRLGVPLDQDFPYSVENFQTEPPFKSYLYSRNYGDIKYYRLDYQYISGEELLAQIKIVLATGFPCMFAIKAFSALDAVGDDGLILYSEPAETEQGHALVAVGYDDYRQVGSSIGAILVRNSWGEGWGIKGHGWLPYDYIRNPKLTRDCWVLLDWKWVDQYKFGIKSSGLWSEIGKDRPGRAN